MGFLSKTYDRYRTDELRLEDMSSDYVEEGMFNTYIKVTDLYNLVRKSKYYIKDIDINQPQFIKWELRRRSRLSLKMEKIGECFVITDPKNKSYIHYNSYSCKLTSGKYDENVVSNKINCKTKFDKTIRYYINHSWKSIINITEEELSDYKKIFKPINKIYNKYKEKNMSRVNMWIHNRL